MFVFLLFFFYNRKSIWDRRRHLFQLSALSPAKPQGTLCISTSTMPGNDIISAWGGWQANKNNCYWPRALLQGIFLEPCSAFLRVPCFLVQTYHGLKIPRIFCAVFPLGSHNGAVLLLSSASVLERERGKKKAEALNNPNGNHRGHSVIFRSEKWCRRQQSHLRFTFHCPLLNKRPKSSVIASTWWYRRLTYVCGKAPAVRWVFAWKEEASRMWHLPLTAPLGLRRGNVAPNLLTSMLSCPSAARGTEQQRQILGCV